MIPFLPNHLPDQADAARQVFTGDNIYGGCLWNLLLLFTAQSI